MPKTMTIDGWKLSDFPIAYGPEDYDDARKEIAEKVGPVSGVKTILEWGKPRYPGISDIDFFVVFEQESPSMCIPPSVKLSPKTQYLMKHKFLVISDKHLEDLLYMAPWITYNNPEKLPAIYSKGEANFKKINLSDEEERILNLMFLYEQNEQMVDLATCFHNKSLPLRHILALLNLAKRVVQKANEYCEQKIETDLEARLAKIIKNWFKTDIKEMLPEILYLVEEAARISFTAPFSFADAIKDKVSYVKLDEIVGSSKNRVKNSNNNVFFTSFAYNKLFTDLELTPKEALEASLKMYKKFKMPGKKEEIPLWITVQPYLASVNLTAYFCLEGGLLADRFRKDIFFSGDKFPVLDYPVIAKRTRLIAGLVDHYIPREGQGTQGKGILFGASFFNYLYRDETLKRKLLIRYIKREYFQKLVMLFKNNQR